MRTAILATLVGMLAAMASSVPMESSHRARGFHIHRFRPTRTRRDETATNSTEPCAQVSAHIYANENSINNQVPAGLALDCMLTIPLNVSSALRVIDGLKPYLQWQSTIKSLANPPKEYVQKVQDPVDILRGLDQIANGLKKGEYHSEYEFGWSLYTLIASAHDGHLLYVPDSVGVVFSWGRSLPLVSVSEDGKKLPAVFAYNDVLGMHFKNISYIPSPVVKIDGEDATTFLENWSQFGGLQDRDGLYNNNFYSLSQASLGSQGAATGLFTGGGRARFVFPGDTTTLTFANGSQLVLENYGRSLMSFRNIQNGTDLANNAFLYRTLTAEMGKAESKATAPTVPAVTAGYPDPVVAGPYGMINGFYIDKPGYEDVAVLQVPNFVGSAWGEEEFQETTRKFLPKAAADGKKRLIIDLQANGGGTILQGYDLFKQLFPSIHPYGATRFRAHDDFNLMGQAFSGWAAGRPRVYTTNNTLASLMSSSLVYSSDVNDNDQSFTSWEDKFGPVEVGGDKYTKHIRWNLSDVYTPINSGGIWVSGYGELANASSTQYFAASDIVLLYDGYCASTCAIFSEFMTNQAGVKTIALGGRSNNKPMQAVGGTKGTNNFVFGYVQYWAQLATRVASPSKKNETATAMAKYEGQAVYDRSALVPGLNVRDGIRQGDKTETPLQFVYEEADCRLFYTPEMTIDATAIWAAAADAQWGNNGKCVTSGYTKSAVTKRLGGRHMKKRAVAAAQAAAQMKKFEETFQLETKCELTGDGFMRP